MKIRTIFSILFTFFISLVSVSPRHFQAGKVE